MTLLRGRGCYGSPLIPPGFGLCSQRVQAGPLLVHVAADATTHLGWGALVFHFLLQQRGEAWCEAPTPGRNEPEKSSWRKWLLGAEKDFDIWESQDISDWLDRSSVLNPGQMGRSPHNLDFLRGDAGVGHPAQKEEDSSHSIPGLACRNGHSSLSSSS